MSLLMTPPRLLSLPERFGVFAAKRYSGATDRQLRYWSQSGLLVAHVQEPTGPGVARIWDRADVVALRVVVLLLGSGWSLQRLRKPQGRETYRALWCLLWDAETWTRLPGEDWAPAHPLTNRSVA